MLIKELQNVLNADEYAALQSIKGFDKLNPNKPIAGLAKNGNYHILYLRDGSKLRFGVEDSLTPEYPECIDCTITKKCDNNCSWCYMSCTRDGKHMNLNDPQVKSLLDQIHPCTELAINVNDLSFPELESFLKYMKFLGVFVNATINQDHFVKYFKEFISLSKYICGVGISYMRKDLKFLQMVDRFQWMHGGVVIHMIDALTSMSDFEFLKNRNLSILFLGYKDIGRGKEFKEKHSPIVSVMDYNLATLEYQIQQYIEKPSGFSSIAFDGLAIKDLNIKDHITEKQYKALYAGDEGAYTFYLDLVDKVYAVSSITDDYKPIGNKTIQEMFNDVKTEPLRI